MRMKIALAVAAACTLLLAGVALAPGRLSLTWVPAATGVADPPQPQAPASHGHGADDTLSAERLALARSGITVSGGGAPVTRLEAGADDGGYHHGSWPEPASLGGDFSLVDHRGRPVTLASFTGRPSVIFFGYARCQDICPYSAELMGAALDAMPDRGAGVNALFISFDSRNETREDLARFVARIHPGLVGLTGSRAQVHQVAAKYKVHRQMMPHTLWQAPHQPEWRHTSHYYLLSADGQVVDYVYPSIAPEDLARRLSDLAAGILPVRPPGRLTP